MATSLSNRREVVYASPRLICEFELEVAGIARVAVGQIMREAVHLVVSQTAMPYAISISPVGSTREYVSSWQTVDTYTTIAGMRRAAARLLNNSGHAAAVEWVSKRGFGHGYHVLGRTLAHLGGVSLPGRVGSVRRTVSRAAQPRGPNGRFLPSDSPAALRRRAAAAARKRASGGG